MIESLSPCLFPGLLFGSLFSPFFPGLGLRVSKRTCTCNPVARGPLAVHRGITHAVECQCGVAGRSDVCFLGPDSVPWIRSAINHMESKQYLLFIHCILTFIFFGERERERKNINIVKYGKVIIMVQYYLSFRWRMNYIL